MNPLKRALLAVNEAINADVERLEKDQVQAFGSLSKETTSALLESFVAGMRCSMDIIQKNLQGTAMVDVKLQCSGDCAVDTTSIEYTDRLICAITDEDCPGLGRDGCPAYITTREN